MGTVKKTSGSRPRQQNSPEVMVRGFKKCCIPEEAGNVGSEHESVSNECETRWEL
jgi:hypothetical protein